MVYKVLNGGFPVHSICCNPRGEILASASDDNDIVLWNVTFDSSSTMTTLRGHSDGVMSACFDSTGQFLASGSWDDHIKVWNIADSRETGSFEHSEVRGVSWGSGSLVSAGWTETKLWDIGTGVCIATLPRSGSAQFVNDATTLVLGTGCNVSIIDLRTRGTAGVMSGHEKIVSSLCSLYPFVLASGSYDATVRVWDMRTLGSLRVNKGHSGAVRSVCFNASTDQLITSSNDHTVRVWDASDVSGGRILYSHQQPVTSVCYSPKSSCIMSGSMDSSIRLWHLDVTYSYEYETIPVKRRVNGEVSPLTVRDKKIYRLLETYLPGELVVMAMV